MPILRLLVLVALLAAGPAPLGAEPEPAATAPTVAGEAGDAQALDPVRVLALPAAAIVGFGLLGVALARRQSGG